MKKYLPIMIAVCTIGLFSSLIAKNQYHLAQQPSIYVALQPADPRSIIQGDYMRLNYELHFKDVRAEQIQNQSKITAYIALDDQQRVIATSFQPFSNATHKLRLNNPKNTLQLLYPASNSFLFAEGLAACYQQATFAEFKVSADGQAILASLRDHQLQRLQCEQQKKWHEG